MNYSIFIILLICLIVNVLSDKKHEKYSAKANLPKLPEEKYEPDIRNIKFPYRMAKLNLVWSKAQHRLTEPKLKSLFTELKIQDKEEIAWKQLNAQTKDKDGLKEATLRKKLIGIMSTYGLLEHFEEAQDPANYKKYKGFEGPVSDNYINKSLFKDKKLNSLWEKAEMSGFTPEELKALKEEFEHHQEKVEVYYNLLDNINEGKKDQHENAVNEDELDRYNEIESAVENNVETNEVGDNFNKNSGYLHKTNQLRDHHRTLRDNFDRLERKTASGPNSKDFLEPKVQGLWKVAVASSFTADELASLKVELLHYESRLLKLRHMHAEHALGNEKYKNAQPGDKKHDKLTWMEENIKKQTRKVEKLQEEIEKRVFQHSEL